MKIFFSILGSNFLSILSLFKASSFLDIEVALLARATYEPSAVDGGIAKSQTGRETGYEICIENSGLNNFRIIAEEIGGGNSPCTLRLDRNGQTSETNC